MKSLSDSWVDTLLNWFREVRHPYPWREGRSPYRVWVSEVMLQQTVAATVEERFRRWMERFPNVESLASASEEEVLRMWEGLGYYNRARNLHKSAKILADQGFPESSQGWRSLPGVGPYTAAAIGSLVLREPSPVMDANVLRFLRRFCQEGTSGEELLQRVIPRESPGEFNEALMELGQQICRPRTPLCQECPLKSFCRFFRGGETEPPPQPRKVTIKESWVLMALLQGSLLMEKTLKGRFHGLWRPPILPKRGTLPPVEEMGELFPGGFKDLRPLPPREHLYTRYRELLFPLLFFVQEAGSFQAFSQERLKELPMPTVYRRLVDETLFP